MVTIGVYDWDLDHFLAARFCVERDPEACHRSIVAERLANEHGVSVGHLLPELLGGRTG